MKITWSRGRDQSKEHRELICQVFVWQSWWICPIRFNVIKHDLYIPCKGVSRLWWSFIENSFHKIWYGRMHSYLNLIHFFMESRDGWSMTTNGAICPPFFKHISQIAQYDFYGASKWINLPWTTPASPLTPGRFVMRCWTFSPGTCHKLGSCFWNSWTTLKGETFAGRNFRVFAFFCRFRESKSPRK